MLSLVDVGGLKLVKFFCESGSFNTDMIEVVRTLDFSTGKEINRSKG